MSDSSPLRAHRQPTQGAATGDIYGYLAGVAKDRSEIPTAIGLYHDALVTHRTLTNGSHVHGAAAAAAAGLLLAHCW